MSNSKTVFVTGATGFVGRHLVAAMENCGYKVVVGVRDTKAVHPKGKAKRFVLNEHIDLDLTDVDCVVHLAGLAHTVNASAERLNEINAVGTQRLSQLAAKQGVKKFVFLSSIGVNGCSNEKPFTELSSARPFNDYTRSKYQAEQALIDATEKSSMQSIIIRVPLIYGKAAPGNFQKLVKFADSNIPLPFGDINNKRSLCSITNLCDFILRCCDTKRDDLKQIERFVIADDEPVSTSVLLSTILVALGKTPRLIGVPNTILKLIFRLARKKSLEASLMRDLTIDNSYAKAKLNWQPRTSLLQELAGLNSRDHK